MRVRAELRPDILHIDASLIEFCKLLSIFLFYFYGSNLQNDHLSGQQASFKQLLEYCHTCHGSVLVTSVLKLTIL